LIDSEELDQLGRFVFRRVSGVAFHGEMREEASTVKHDRVVDTFAKL
jgi:hypothetical protein